MIQNATPKILTEPGAPEEIVHGLSQGGWNATNAKWHRLECNRRARKGITTFVRSNGGGRIHLALGIPRPQDTVFYLPEVG